MRITITIDVSPDGRIRTTIDDAVSAPAASSSMPPQHTDDFRLVVWNGRRYDLSATQAAIVRVLWHAREAGTPDVSETALLEEADSNSERLRDVFRRSPAWRSLVVRGEGRGTYRLALPQPEPRKESSP